MTGPLTLTRVTREFVRQLVAEAAKRRMSFHHLPEEPRASLTIGPDWRQSDVSFDDCIDLLQMPFDMAVNEALIPAAQHLLRRLEEKGSAFYTALLPLPLDGLNAARESCSGCSVRCIHQPEVIRWIDGGGVHHVRGLVRFDILYRVKQ